MGCRAASPPPVPAPPAPRAPWVAQASLIGEALEIGPNRAVLGREPEIDPVSGLEVCLREQVERRDV